MSDAIDRRALLGVMTALTMAPGCVTGGSRGRRGAAPAIPVRAVTTGPWQHWFGYYDKDQFDPSGTKLLGMRTQVRNRAPAPDDSIEIGLVHLDQDCRWEAIGTSRAWGWQQGCMLQWVPGTRATALWNDREGDRFVTRTVDLTTGARRTLPEPIYALSPDGRWAAGVSFSRIQDLRPGYGYAGIPDAYFEQRAPDAIGLYRLDLASGRTTMLMSLAQAAAITDPSGPLADRFHWFNHALINTDGSRLTFLHRWRSRREERQAMAVGGFTTRMITMDVDGAAPFIIDPSGHTSHFVWRDPTTICAWTRPVGRPFGFYLLTDRTGAITSLGAGVMTENGHQTYVPGRDRRWLLNDTYPAEGTRAQTLYLYDVASDRKHDLGRFPAAPDATAEWRCDLHPKASRDGNFVCFDSTHGGNGRQMYVADLRPFWDWALG